MMKVTYLTETMIVIAQKTSETTPYTLAWFGVTTCPCALKTVCSA